MSDESDLNVLFPDREVEVKGEKLTIRPFGFGQLSRVSRYVRPIAQAMLNSGMLTVIPPAEGETTAKIKLSDNFVPQLFAIIEEASEPLMMLVAFAISKDRAWLDDIPPDVGIHLTQQLWEVNADFFVKRVAPMLKLDFTSIGSTSTGATSSQDSSAQATGAETSTITASDR